MIRLYLMAGLAAIVAAVAAYVFVLQTKLDKSQKQAEMAQADAARARSQADVSKATVTILDKVYHDNRQTLDELAKGKGRISRSPNRAAIVPLDIADAWRGSIVRLRSTATADPSVASASARGSEELPAPGVTGGG